MRGRGRWGASSSSSHAGRVEGIGLPCGGDPVVSDLGVLVEVDGVDGVLEGDVAY